MEKYLLVYLAVISVVSVAVTCYDKYASKRRPRNRVPEKVLLALSAAGGSAAMLITMLTIRHKTRHAKFMVGIPVMLAVQLAALCYFKK